MIVGMDFGTTNSGMAVYDGEQIRLIPLDFANRNPSVARTALYITNDRNLYIGREAMEQYYEQNLNRPVKMERVWVGEIEMTFAELPTFIRDVYIEKDLFEPGRLFRSFKMGLSSESYLGTVVGSSYYFLEDIIAIYLYLAKTRAEAYLQTELDTIVLGRPVRFSDNEEQNQFAKERLLQSAFRAGYSRVYLQEEPIAAAYYYETTIQEEQNVLIFDFGGGTLDISILRIGNPKTREVLATGGIPIAGDIFDQRIIRHKLPKHFGEGTMYRSGNKDLQVPSTFFEAFTNWQELMNLQMPETLDKLKTIQHTAEKPKKLQSLINLITTNYGMKMFDVAEEGKRKLSDGMYTTMKFEGEGFYINEMLTRIEFERIIRPQMNAIAKRLDEVVASAGLKPDAINAVIRTGGSSQIPVFIEMLESRFGAEKVKDVDVFSSVTSGLGILAHQIEQGELDSPVYTPDTTEGGAHLNTNKQGGIPVIDLDLMKRLIDQREEEPEISEDSARIFISQLDNQKLQVLELADYEHDTAYKLPRPDNAMYERFPYLLNSQAKMLFLTSEYRAILRSARELADLYAVGFSLEANEGFRSNAFGSEHITGICRWDTLQNSESILFLSTLGYALVLRGQQLLEKLDQPVPYNLQKLRGYPAILIGASNEDEFVVFSDSGRGLRIKHSTLSHLEQRILQVPMKNKIVSAIAVSQPSQILLVTKSGYGKLIETESIPLAKETGTNGTKISIRANLVSAVLVQKQRYTLVTNQRMIPIDPSTIPLQNLAKTDHKLVKLKKGEQVLGII